MFGGDLKRGALPEKEDGHVSEGFWDHPQSGLLERFAALGARRQWGGMTAAATDAADGA
jgi:hypothetical protein